MNIAHLLAGKGRGVVTIGPEDSIRQALGLLAQHNIGALIVVDNRQQPVGILSERDIVREAARNEGMFAQPVSALMTRNVIIGAPQDDVQAVAHTMTERRIRHVPVMDQGALVGIVSIGDLVKAQRDEYLGELETLQTQLLANKT
ncbi:MAG: CBS domain-containing protein [Candidatus Rokubacteria bacterium]|nr:CBS domain-containing protein [Candidatus Rokubacteria bacterium]